MSDLNLGPSNQIRYQFSCKSRDLSCDYALTYDMKLIGCFLLYFLQYTSFHWFPLVSTSFHWFPLVCTGFHWFPVVFHWFPVVSSGFSLVSISFSFKYLCLPSVTHSTVIYGLFLIMKWFETIPLSNLVFDDY